MKIAFCMSGQPRTAEMGFKMINKYLLKPNQEFKIDFFLHAWYDREEIGKPWSSAQNYPIGKSGYVEDGTDSYLLEVYKPKKWLFEKQISFLDYTKNFNSVPNAKPEILSSIFYSIYMSNQLKREYEIENNFKYDLVIRTRYDLAYMKKIDLHGLLSKKHKVIVPENFQIDQDNFFNINKPMVDIFAASSSEQMDIFCSVFPNMRMLNNKLNPPLGENYLGQWVRNENNLSLHLDKDIEVQLIHRMIDLRRFT